jgi:hypothetical protein
MMMTLMSFPNQEVKFFFRAEKLTNFQLPRQNFHHRQLHPLSRLRLLSNHSIIPQINSGTVVSVMPQLLRFTSFGTSNRLTIRLAVSKTNPQTVPSFCKQSFSQTRTNPYRSQHVMTKLLLTFLNDYSRR